MRKLFAGLTTIALFCAAAAQAVTIQENTAFPDMNVIVSQTNWTSQLGLQDRLINSGTTTNDLSIGQSFKIDSPTTLRAITIQNHSGKSWGTNATHALELWIGSNDGTASNFVAGATNLLTTIDLSGQSLGADYVTFNLDSDLSLAAGDYGFQLNWTTRDSSHFMYAKRIDGGSTYTNGGWLYDTTDGGTLPFDDSDAPIANDLVFALHTAVVGTVPTFSVNPEEVNMILVPPYNQVTGAVEVVYTSDTNLNIDVSISNESHPGSLSVLSYPSTITSNTLFEFEFDNSVSNLVEGQSATGLATIAWSEVGSTVTNEVVLPITASTGFAPGANNAFNGAGDGVHWGDTNNWSLDRIPGALGKDIALIQGGATATVATNFFAPFSWDMTIRSLGTLNIAADLSNGGAMRLGNNSGHIGYVNHTAGAVDVTSLAIGEAAGAAPSNSVYHMTGGSVDTGALTIHPTGELKLDGGTMATKTINIASSNVLNITGGTFSIDQGPANITVNNAGSLIKVQSGTFTTLGTAASDVLTVNAGVEISGGTVDLNGQNKFPGGLKVIGDAASITISRFNQTSSGTTAPYIFEMGATGVSTINSPSFCHLRYSEITVDGSAYAGGSQTIDLFSSGNIASLCPSVIITNFPAGVTAVFTQSTSLNIAQLEITVPGYAGWISDYGLSGSPDADANYDYDLDGVNNLYEYALNGDPTNGAVTGADSAMLPGSGYLDYVHARRVAATNELSYGLGLTGNLTVGTWTTNSGYTVVGYGPVVGGFDTVTNRIDTTGKTAEFIDLVIEQLP